MQPAVTPVASDSVLPAATPALVWQKPRIVHPTCNSEGAQGIGPTGVCLVGIATIGRTGPMRAASPEAYTASLASGNKRSSSLRTKRDVSNNTPSLRTNCKWARSRFISAGSFARATAFSS